MSANPFQKASRSQVFLKLAITGPTGSGKTFSALRLAKGLIEESGKRIAFLDTENDSASLYSDSFDFDTLPIAPPFEAIAFQTGIEAAVANDYGCVIIDSASHIWRGILKYKGELDARGGNQWTNWRDPDKKFQEAIDAVLQSKIHVVFCMRSKMEYEQVKDGNKSAIVKVGLAPIMKDDLEYEFTSVLDIQMDHKAKASKDRSGLFPDDKIFQITEETGMLVANWLKTATPKPEPPKPEPVVQLTEEAAWEGYIAKFRDEILGKNNATGHDAATFEELWCGAMSKHIADGKTRAKLEEFTLMEFRGIVWKWRTDVLAEANKFAKEAR